MNDYVSEAEAMEDWYDWEDNNGWEDDNDLEDDTHSNRLEPDLANLTTNATQVYKDNKKARVGANIKCPTCGKTFLKKTYQHTFCIKSKCKDIYHNSTNIKRKMRARKYSK